MRTGRFGPGWKEHGDHGGTEGTERNRVAQTSQQKAGRLKRSGAGSGKAKRFFPFTIKFPPFPPMM